VDQAPLVPPELHKCRPHPPDAVRTPRTPRTSRFPLKIEQKIGNPMASRRSFNLLARISRRSLGCRSASGGSLLVQRSIITSDQQQGSSFTSTTMPSKPYYDRCFSSSVMEDDDMHSILYPPASAFVGHPAPSFSTGGRQRYPRDMLQ